MPTVIKAGLRSVQDMAPRPKGDMDILEAIVRQKAIQLEGLGRIPRLPKEARFALLRAREDVLLAVEHIHSHMRSQSHMQKPKPTSDTA